MSDCSAGPVLLLSIDEQHISRILSGVKSFEIRKSLPKTGFQRVYMYQTGGRGVVGWFHVADVVRLPLSELWDHVGRAATSKRRFEAYFEGYSNGCAISVANVVEFDRSIPSSILRKVYPRFHAPQSYQLLRPKHRLHEYLESCRRYQASCADIPIRLEPISQSAIPRFRELVLNVIGRHYDEIDDSFVDSIIETHDEGHDPVGFFTEFKEALSIKGAHNKILGFTTITYKKGGSAKTGPTILLEEHRGEGIGQYVRTAVERRILFQGYRKVYCTAPTVSPSVIRYLQKSDYRIEAQLSKQYTHEHDELVFGKLLLTDLPELFLNPINGSGRAGRVICSSSNEIQEPIQDIAGLLRQAWFPFDDAAADRVAEEVVSERSGSIRKPKNGVVLLSGDQVVGIALLLPKRGGSVKVLIISGTNHTPSLERLVEAACAKASELGGRRAYVLHPVGDARTIGILRRNAFMPEGLLVAPYAPGQDLVVYGHHL